MTPSGRFFIALPPFGDLPVYLVRKLSGAPAAEVIMKADSESELRI